MKAKAVLGCFGDYDPAHNFCKYECTMQEACKMWGELLAVPVELWILACKLSARHKRLPVRREAWRVRRMKP